MREATRLGVSDPDLGIGSREAPGQNAAGIGDEQNGSGSAESDALKEPNGTARQAVSNGTASAAGAVSPPARRRAGPRKLQLTLAASLALACIAAAVLSVRAFVLASTNRFPGVIQPAQAISLDFSEVGYLSSLRVNPGDHVRAGEILARLEPVGAHAVELAAAASTAAVAADQEDLTVARQDVTALPAVQQAGVRRAKAQLAADQAQLAETKVVLDQATIRSPVNGLVVNVSGSVGDLVGPNGIQIDGSAQPPELAQTPNLSLFSQASQHSAAAKRNTTTPLIQLAAGTTEMEAQVSESAVGELRPGRRATVTVPALGASFSARLLRVAPDPVQAHGNVSYEVVFTLRRPSPQVLPGMSADVTLSR